MADAGVPANGFKPEMIEFVIESVQEVWSDKSQEKLEALFAYLMSKGVKSEADVDSIDEEELGAVIGPEAARKIFQHVREAEKGEAEDHGKENKDPEDLGKENKDPHAEPSPEGESDGKPEVPHKQSDIAADSGSPPQNLGECQNSGTGIEGAADPATSSPHLSGSQNGMIATVGTADSTMLPVQMNGNQNMTEMFKMFMQLQAVERDKNREMILDLQKGMQNTIEKVTVSIMSSMKEMNDKLTQQMCLQQQLLDKLSGQIVAAEERHQETARQTQEWMASTQEMNQKMLMELTRKVNAALEAKEDALNEMKKALAAPKPTVVHHHHRQDCTIL